MKEWTSESIDARWAFGDPDMSEPRFRAAVVAEDGDEGRTHIARRL